jgi:diguanylate cyclase (GGDEF)-like protein/PAS domain S-box-containing protein
MEPAKKYRIGSRSPQRYQLSNGSNAMVFTAQENISQQLTPSPPFALLDNINYRSRGLDQLKLSATLSAEAIAITDSAGNFKFVNDAFEAMSGYCSDELLGRNWMELVSGPKSGKSFAAYAADLEAKHTKRNIIPQHKKDGGIYHLVHHARRFVDENGCTTDWVFTGRDASGGVATLQHLIHLANYDSLTNLPCRTLVFDRLQQALKHAARNSCGFTVAIIDIDKFKVINDSFGHIAGDSVLQEVALRIKHCLREEDTVGRLSGDDFMLILTGIDQPDAVAAVIEKIHAACMKNIPVNGSHARVSVSIGTATYPHDGLDQRSLLEHADAAMYQNKNVYHNKNPTHRHNSTTYF